MSKPVRPPEIAELRAFCAAVDLGSLGRAARLLQVSQPALSKRLRTLEAVAGAQLLERSPRGVCPTAAGRELYVAARKLLAEVEVVEALMGSPTPREAPARLAVSPTLAEFALPGPLVEFGRHHLIARRVRGLRFTRRFALVHGGDGNLRPVARALADQLLHPSSTSSLRSSPYSP